VRLALLAVVVALAAQLLAPPAQAKARQWQILNTESFRVMHFDAAAARRVVNLAEAARLGLIRRWTGTRQPSAWRPRCDLYLYPTNKLLVYMTGGRRKAGSARAVPSRLYRGRVLARRINLALDDRRVLTATLPHELTHIIIRDLVQKPPLWANEGIAISSEPVRDQRLYSALLARHLRRGPLYPVKTVMTAHRYPERRYVHLFYAQSASLVRYLRSLGRRDEPAVQRNARLLRFLNSASKVGVEAALRQVYAIGGYPDLQRRWLAFARRSKLAR
jgi:hypothetical protein